VALFQAHDIRHSLLEHFLGGHDPARPCADDDASVFRFETKRQFRFHSEVLQKFMRKNSLDLIGNCVRERCEKLISLLDMGHENLRVQR
jgi:hypothetical protein